MPLVGQALGIRGITDTWRRAIVFAKSIVFGWVEAIKRDAPTMRDDLVERFWRLVTACRIGTHIERRW